MKVEFRSLLLFTQKEKTFAAVNLYSLASDSYPAFELQCV
jgi:hypothetical protein